MHTSTHLHLRIRGLLTLLLTLALLPLLALPAHAAGFTVTTLDDSGAGSLRQAILDANATSGADTITFTLSGTIVLASTLPAIDDELTIDGTGQSITISGNNAVRVMVVNSGTTLNLNGLTVADGLCSNCAGGGIFTNGGTVNINHSTFSGNRTTCVSNCGVSGGAIANLGGVLHVSNSTFAGNSASFGNGGGIAINSGSLTVSDSSFSANSVSSGNGGGISINNANVTVSTSTFSSNSASQDSGGINAASGSVTVSNSTFAGNSASRFGGGILNDFRSTLTVSNSTFAGNSAGNQGGGILNNGGSTTLKNTIVANSTAGGDCWGTISADSHTLASDGSCGGATVKSAAELKLGPLANNGGPTQTIALLPGSAAIDAGDDTICAAAPVNNLDQRGITRPQGSACDIGAFEVEVVDPTPPQITPTVSGTLGANGWYTGDVSVSWSVTDAESAVSSKTGCDNQSVTSDTTGVIFTCSATSAGGSSSQSVTIKRDATAPTISFANRTAPNAAGWNNGSVIVNWTCSDATSGVVSANVSQTVSAEEANQSATGTCTDNAGNSASDTQTGINIDTTAPTLAPSVSPNPVILGGSATVSPGAFDAISGLATASCGTPDTSSIGTKSVSCTASDIAGNQASTSANYQVVYPFGGFVGPVDAPPTVNVVKAGAGVPVKFSLGGNYGLNIFAAGYPKVQTVACDSGAPTDEIEQTVTAGASTLSYDAATNTYSYTWKTDKSWAGSCRQLVVGLVDGTSHTALFKFK